MKLLNRFSANLLSHPISNCIANRSVSNIRIAIRLYIDEKHWKVIAFRFQIIDSGFRHPAIKSSLNWISLIFYFAVWTKNSISLSFGRIWVADDLTKDSATQGWNLLKCWMQPATIAYSIYEPFNVKIVPIKTKFN